MDEVKTRPRGILTQADRKYLRGEKELTDQSERNTRRRIRNRVYQSLLDFTLLWDFLGEDDLEQIFANDSDEKRSNIRSAVQDMMAFSILGLSENGDYWPWRLEDAIRQASYARKRRADIQFQVDEHPMDSPDEILYRILDSELEHLSYEEFEYAIENPDADPELVAEAYNQIEGEEVITPEEVKEIQELARDSPFVRPTPPQITSVEPDFRFKENGESAY